MWGASQDRRNFKFVPSSVPNRAALIQALCRLLTGLYAAKLFMGWRCHQKPPHANTAPRDTRLNPTPSPLCRGLLSKGALESKKSRQSGVGCRGACRVSMSTQSPGKAEAITSGRTCGDP